MLLEILLPHGVFARISGVTRVVAVTRTGSVGLLPHRLDCAVALTPGLLTYAAGNESDVHVAVDSGVLVKTADRVQVCVRHAIAGADLGRLREAVEKEFLNLSEQEKVTRSILAQLETGLIRRLLELRHG
jgi:F-type H+-transporting ATPase subunit epsilon